MSPPAPPRPLVAATERELWALGDRVVALLREAPGGTVAVDVAGLTAPDLGTLDALLRLQLVARRHGGRVEMLGIRPRLRRLIDMTGLAVEVPEHRPRHGRGPGCHA